MLAHTPDEPEQPDEEPGHLNAAPAALRALSADFRRIAMRDGSLRCAILARDALAHAAERLARGCSRIDYAEALGVEVGRYLGCATWHGGLARFSMALDEALGLGVWTDTGPSRWRDWRPIPGLHFLAPRPTLKLSRRDSERVAAALLSPPEPNQAMLDAARDYREAVERGEITSR